MQSSIPESLTLGSRRQKRRSTRVPNFRSMGAGRNSKANGPPGQGIPNWRKQGEAPIEPGSAPNLRASSFASRSRNPQPPNQIVGVRLRTPPNRTRRSPRNLTPQRPSASKCVGPTPSVERLGDLAVIELGKVSCPRWRLYVQVDRGTCGRVVWPGGANQHSGDSMPRGLFPPGPPIA